MFRHQVYGASQPAEQIHSRPRDGRVTPQPRVSRQQQQQIVSSNLATFYRDKPKTRCAGRAAYRYIAGAAHMRTCSPSSNNSGRPIGLVPPLAAHRSPLPAHLLPHSHAKATKINPFLSETTSSSCARYIKLQV